MATKYPFGISVVIPVYNSADRIVDTVEKITEHFAKSYTALELILIDDASHDKSPDVISQVASVNDLVRYRTHPINLGQQKTIAEGLLIARHDIILTVDADLPCSLEDLSTIAQIAQREVEIIFCRRPNLKRTVWWRTLGSIIVNAAFRILYHYEIRDFGCGIAAMRRSLIEKLRFSNRPIGLIKMDLLGLAETYKEIELSSAASDNSTRSSYSLRKLLNLFWQMLLYKFR